VQYKNLCIADKHNFFVNVLQLIQHLQRSALYYCNSLHINKSCISTVMHVISWQSARHFTSSTTTASSLAGRLFTRWSRQKSSKW